MKGISIAAALLSVIVAAPAAAGTSTAVMPVTAVVASTCAVAAQPLIFGQLSLSGGNNDTQTTVTLTCTPGVTYNVGMDAGAHANGGVRHLIGTVGNSTVPYYIYADAARTTEWGNTINSNTVNGTAATAVTNLTVYGRVPGQASFFTAGGYSDAVTVTLTF